MATIRTLVCYKGRTGATVTLSIASPCVVTASPNEAKTGESVVFTTAGALPTGVVSGTTYYMRDLGDSATFNIYDTYAHAVNTGSTTGIINTSGTQSGVHTVKAAYWYNLDTAGKAVYGSAGSERVYSTLFSALEARSSVTVKTNIERIELVSIINCKKSVCVKIKYRCFRTHTRMPVILKRRIA